MKRHLPLLVLLFAAGGLCAAAASSGEWIRGLYKRPRVSRGEVLLAAGLMVDDAHWKDDPAWALQVAHARGLSHDEAAELPRTANRGYACHVFARLLKIHGGLFSRITGQGGRYAYRELVLLGMIPDGGSSVTLTGDELAGLMLAAARYQERGPVRPAGF